MIQEFPRNTRAARLRRGVPRWILPAAVAIALVAAAVMAFYPH